MCQLSVYLYIQCIITPSQQEIEAIMHEFEEVLGSCRSDGLVCSVLKGWTLLLSLLPPRVAAVILTRCVYKSFC